jgi:RNA-binding protein
MPLKSSQIRYLRGLAHALKPIVAVGGKGLTPAVSTEFATALEYHELVKVKLAVDDREARVALVERLAAEAGAEVVQRVGKTATFYKANPERQRVELPR